MIKRLFDIMVSLTVLILFSPILIAVGGKVLTVMGWPIFFKQKRPGKNGIVFEMVKFRTMTSAKSSGNELLPNEDRTPALGHFLRNSSLDELPEFWNVLKGDMSVVGPRPLKIEYLPLYNDFQSRRHEVKPGITGWAQINGRNSATWNDRFALDVWYVENMSLFIDVKILFLTVYKVIKKEGVEHPLNEVESRFLGNENDK